MSKYSRAEGRRVAKSMARSSITVEDIESAAKSLGLTPVVEKDKSYPRYWFKKRGRVLVPKKMHKSKLLKKISESFLK